MVSPQIIGTVLQKAVEVATHSWEYGTVAEALLEWNDPKLSIWNDPFPGGKVPKLDVGSVRALEYVRPFIKTTGNTLVDGDAAGDPPALGIPALLIGKSNQTYWDAAIRQQQHLVKDVPRWPNGAISHREAYPELWADFVYMVPPFLAYTGVATSSLPLLQEAFQQCKHYHSALSQPSGSWRHIIGTSSNKDAALWSTGNAWAAAGLSRVLATFQKSPWSSQTTVEQTQLTTYIKQILDGAIAFDTDSSGLLRNYLDDASWWGEISGTALLAATALRMARLDAAAFGRGKYVDWAEKKMRVVEGRIEQATGVVKPAVNPLDWKDRKQFNTGSPEGQAFVVLLEAAWRDWKGGV
ncbi:hypothetical protein DM02DRAFT_579493 [Periconia macrospinosa]|uniref:Six-hairpin glycosidase n=1 Tax=Periconia macrospinosa TaxID=97972 RepID=A0A2V1EFK2_9PLEO|nr:hypothetical protein DM02DRAFT_579493 [Periconia macrospinosa]